MALVNAGWAKARYNISVHAQHEVVSIDRAQRARPRGLDDPYIDGWLPHDGGEHVWVSVVDRAHNSTEALSL